jgi:hypothetical protein
MSDQTPTGGAPRRDRWYGSLKRWDGRRGRVQTGSDLRTRDGKGLTLPEPVLRLAQTEYERRYGHQQDYERMQERGGLSLMEVVGLLADYCERLGGRPTAPRGTTDDR